MTALEMTGILAAASAALALGALVLRARVRMRGTRVITCPETLAPAAVTLDPGFGLLEAALGHPHFRLRDCTRWPEKAGCGQMCLDQVEAGPQDCLVRNILGRWYLGKDCAYCGRTFSEIHWHDHTPGLLTPEGRLVEWSEIPPVTVPSVLGTHRPVCWNCLVTETFRRVRADLVVERPRPHLH